MNHSSAEVVTVPRTYLVTLSELAAELCALSLVDDVRHGRVLHPGHVFGKILCETWRIDPLAVLNIATSFVARLRRQCRDAGIAVPSLPDIVLGFDLAIQRDLYSDVPVPTMLEFIQQELTRLNATDS